ncbi:MAG: DMT family transporter [Gammaproteobacteria bacterium]|nr:DMT family transporter [Gammaproteobacteria bacterium]
MLISFSAVFVALIDMGSTAIGFYRVGIAGVILVIIVLVGRKTLIGSGGFLLLGAACFFYMGDLWVWHQSIAWIGPGLATLLAAFQVFVLTTFGVLFLGERAGWRLLVAIPLALIGLGLLVGIDWSVLSAEKRNGVWLGLATAVFYSGYLLSLRQARFRTADRGPTADLAWVSLGTALLLGLASIPAGDSLVVTNIEDGLWLVSYAIGSQVIGWMLITSSLPHVPASRAGLLLLLQPTLSFVWDIVFFARGITAYEAGGAILALFAIWLGSQRDNSPATTDKMQKPV